jgi:hypothetical protein
MAWQRKLMRHTFVASTATEMQLHSPDPFARRRVMTTDYAAAEEEEEGK